jgi:hypothetical protein
MTGLPLHVVMRELEWRHMQVNMTQPKRGKEKQLRLFPDLIAEYRDELLKAKWEQPERVRRFLDRLEQSRQRLLNASRVSKS